MDPAMSSMLTGNPLPAGILFSFRYRFILQMQGEELVYLVPLSEETNFFPNIYKWQNNDSLTEAH